MSDPLLRVMVWVGSLRRASWNRKLFEAARGLAPAGLSLEPFDLAPLPFFDGDLDGPSPPPPVRALQAGLRSAGGLLIVTPEYNFGPPALVKNAIDWASRPTEGSPLQDKPVGLMGASVSIVGTVRAQLQLRQNLLSTRSLVLPQPEVLVGRVHEKFDAAGALKDEGARKVVAAFMDAFGSWVRRPA